MNTLSGCAPDHIDIFRIHIANPLPMGFEQKSMKRPIHIIRII